MSHATSAGVTCDIAPPPNHIATSQNGPQGSIMYMQGRGIKPPAISETQAQQSFIDEREELPEPKEKKQRGPIPRSQQEPVQVIEAEVNESPGDEKDERSNYSDEETPELADSEADPEELRALPEQEDEDETIEDVYPYLREAKRVTGVARKLRPEHHER